MPDLDKPEPKFCHFVQDFIVRHLTQANPKAKFCQKAQDFIVRRVKPSP